MQFIEGDGRVAVNINEVLSCTKRDSNWLLFLMRGESEVDLHFDTEERRDAVFNKLIGKDKPVEDVKVAAAALKFEDITFTDVITCLKKIGFLDVCIAPRKSEVWAEVLVFQLKSTAGTHDFDHRFEYPVPRTIKDWQSLIRRICIRVTPIPIPYFSGNTLDYDFGYDLDLAEPPAPIDVRQRPLEFEDIHDDYIKALLDKLGVTDVHMSRFPPENGLLLSFINKPAREADLVYCSPSTIEDWQKIIQEACRHSDEKLFIPTFIGDSLEYYYETGVVQVVTPEPLKRTVLPLEGLDAEGIKSTCDQAANILEENLIKEGRLEEQPVPETCPLAPGLKFEDINFEYIENLLYKLGFYYITIYPYDESGVAEDDVVFKLESRENKHVWRYPLPKTIKEWQSIICEMCSNARDLPIPTFIGETLEYDYERAEKERPKPTQQENNFNVKFEDIEDTHIAAILENLGFGLVGIGWVGESSTTVCIVVTRGHNDTSPTYGASYTAPKCIAHWQAIIIDMCRGTARFIPQFLGEYTLCYIDKGDPADADKLEKPKPAIKPVSIFKFEDITPGLITGVLETLGFSDIKITHYPAGLNLIDCRSIEVCLTYHGQFKRGDYYQPDSIAGWQEVIIDSCRRFDIKPPHFFVEDSFCYATDYGNALHTYDPVVDERNAPIEIVKMDAITTEHICGVLHRLGFRNVVVAFPGSAVHLHVDVIAEDGTPSTYHDYYAHPNTVGGWQFIIKDMCKKAGKPEPEFNGWLKVNKIDEEDIK